MNSTQNPLHGYFKALSIVFLGLLSGQVFFGLIAFFLQFSGKLGPVGAELLNVFVYVVAVLIVGGFISSRLMFNKMLKLAKEKTDLSEKMTAYRSALIIRYALLEAPIFFSILAYVYLGHYFFLVTAALLLVYFTTLRPTPFKAVRDLDMSSTEMEILNRATQ